MISEKERKALDRAPIVIENIPSSYELRPECWQGVSESEWNSFRWQWSNRLLTAGSIDRAVHLSEDEKQAVLRAADRFSAAVSPHYAALIRPELGPECPIRIQAVPDLRENEIHEELMSDPLGEMRHAIDKCAVHRYPDRALIYAAHDCAMRCRHCTRRSRVGLMETVTMRELQNAVDAVAANPNIRDVLISGGDPLSLGNQTLEFLFKSLKSCPHIDVVRLCTRMPCTQPQRLFDPGLIEILKRYAPIYVNTQFNHPFEATVESERALAELRSAGCIIGNQSVLLRGVNDRAEILEPLFRWLLKNGCRPYYLFLCDVAQGTHHFRTTIKTGLDIMKFLRGRLSGLAIPHFVIDLPNGNGKIDLAPDSMISHEGQCITFKNWFGDAVRYMEPE